MLPKPKPSLEQLGYTPKWALAEQIEKQADEQIRLHRDFVRETRTLKHLTRSELEELKLKMDRKKATTYAGPVDAATGAKRHHDKRAAAPATASFTDVESESDAASRESRAADPGGYDNDRWDPGLGPIGTIETIEEEIVDVREDPLPGAKDAEFGERFVAESSPAPRRLTERDKDAAFVAELSEGLRAPATSSEDASFEDTASEGAASENGGAPTAQDISRAPGTDTSSTRSSSAAADARVEQPNARTKPTRKLKKLSLADFGLPQPKFASKEADSSASSPDSETSKKPAVRVPVLPDASPDAKNPPDVASGENESAERAAAVEATQKRDGVLSDPEFASPDEASAERVCVRCHQLTHQGFVKRGDSVDRTDFRKALSEILKSNRRAVILSVVDVMDFHGTLLKDLKDIVGPRHPVIFAVNKVDVLPRDCSNTRLNKFVRKAATGMGLWVYDVLLVSALKGSNIRRSFEVIRSLCMSEGRDIYVVGATNVGKSSFINQMLQKGLIKNHRQFSTTTSVFPGTTLDLIDFPLPIHPRNKLYDTPGILSETQLSAKLQFDELRLITCKKAIKPRTYKVAAGQSMMFGGGLARIDITDGRPFYLTVFMSPTVSIHIGKTERIEEVLRKNIGQRFAPPSTYERHEQLQWSPRIENQRLRGRGWFESCQDVVFSGLGWVAFTGCGDFSFSAWGPANADVRMRECLMPWESRKSYRRFTGVAK